MTFASQENDMTQLYGTAVYPKNVPRWERGLRVVAAVALGLIIWSTSPEPWTRWVGIGSAALFGLTGFFGFCPACYLVGRKPVS
jgi:hypothetical protein